MSNLWSEIDRIIELKVFIEGGGDSADVYANTLWRYEPKHQVEVQVVVQAIKIVRDNNGMEKHVSLNLLPEEIYKNITFVDYKNVEFSPYDIQSSQVKGEYFTGNSSHKNKINHASFYLSSTKVLYPIKLCVRCYAKNIEYSTAKLNNASEFPHSFIILNTLEPRRYLQKDIILNTEKDKKMGSGKELIKYYMFLNGIERAEFIGKTGEWFHYRQKGNYKGSSNSTDSDYEINLEKKYTKTYAYTNNNSTTITSNNHEYKGFCFWAYRQWKGGIWTNRDNLGNYNFSIIDQDGTKVNVFVYVMPDERIEFIVD